MAVILMLVLVVAQSAVAAPPEFLLQIPEGEGASGERAADLDNPRGVAGNAKTGHVYVADRRNARISEYTAWGLFVKAWGWGVRDGSNELQTCGPAQPAATPPGSLCRKGLPGAGAGQMALLRGGIEVDAGGNVWVGDMENLRVQKFGADGEFLLMLGGKVNATKVAEGAPTPEQNVCPVDPGDVCQAGSTGSAPSHLAGAVGGDYMAYATGANAILVGDTNRIQIFNLDGSYRDEIPFNLDLAAFAGKSVNALDVDELGHIYFSLANLADVYKLSPFGQPVAPGKPGESKFEVSVPTAVAIDVGGNVYAIDQEPTLKVVPEVSVFKFDASGNKIVPTRSEEEAGEFFPDVPFQGPALTALDTNICADGISPDSEGPGNLYVGFYSGVGSHVNAYGSPPIGCEPPPIGDPEVLSQFASSVGREEATVKAQINPHFWQDTTYYVEYGTGRCSEGGCDRKAPLPPAALTTKSVNKGVTTAGVVLSGLEPGTSYHYRFVAQSGGGGPVFGIDPDGREGPEEADAGAGIEGIFMTFKTPRPQPCPNDALRTGLGAKLPDCRAYEMVSPLEKGNADVALWAGRNALAPLLYELHQSNPTGGRFTYTSWTSFGNPAGAGFVSQYLAERRPLGASQPGWASKGLSPPRTASPVDTLALLSGEFQGLSEDLCAAWIRHQSAAPLAEGAIPNYPNFYRRENCGSAPHYLALSPAKPKNTSSEKYYELRVQGFSESGSHTIFTANGSLDGTDAPGTPPLGEIELLLYEHSPDGLRFVCYLPNGNPVAQPCGAGTAAGVSGGNTSSIHNAISADGERIFWTAYSGSPGFGEQPGAPGRIFARVDGTQTVRISGTVSADPAWYWTASNDGSKAIFSFDSGPLKDELYEVDVDTETPTLIAKGVDGPMGASEDASRIYFASSEDLDGEGAATKGAHNLYFYEAAKGGGEATYAFVMVLGSKDIDGYFTDPAPIDEIPAHRWARVSADGLHATFVSAASPTPTGYDNRDGTSGEASREVYLYDAAEDELRCVSCNPTGARPSAANMGGTVNPVWAAARIQGWEIQHHAPRVLSADGRRVFFESHEALVPHDTNGVWDVYQWEEAGKGGCTASSASFDEASGGCIDLISSGDSARDSTFLDADPSGDNVFFGTLASLVPQDYGLNDVYAARIGGGFPPPRRVSECEGEACQSPPAPPARVTPSSEAFEGPENARPRKRCRRGQRKVRRGGKVRCVRKSKRQHRKKSQRHHRRAAR